MNTRRVMGVAVLLVGLFSCDDGSNSEGEEGVQIECTNPGLPVDQCFTSAEARYCAVQNYAGCETRLCLVLERDGTGVCSHACSVDAPCAAALSCETPLGQACEAGAPECYCVPSDLGG